MMHWNDGGWMFGFGWIFMVIFWILVIGGIILLFKAVTGGTKSEEKTETALDVLKKRYARGEINKEEFEDKKKDLGA